MKKTKLKVHIPCKACGSRMTLYEIDEDTGTVYFKCLRCHVEIITDESAYKKAIKKSDTIYTRE